MTDDKVQIEDVKTWLRNLGCSEVAVEEINAAIFKSARRTDALQAERDKLADEYANLKSAIGGKATEEQTFRFIIRGYLAYQAAEAKLTALVEAATAVQEAWILDPCTARFKHQRRLKEALAQALAHHSAPPTTPTSAPVEDIGGLEPDDLEWLRRIFDWNDQRNFADQSKLYATKHQERHRRILAALSEGRAKAADDNHKALVEALMNSAVGLEYMAANRGGKLAREFKDQAAKNRALIAASQSRQEEKQP